MYARFSRILAILACFAIPFSASALENETFKKSDVIAVFQKTKATYDAKMQTKPSISVNQSKILSSVEKQFIKALRAYDNLPSSASAKTRIKAATQAKSAKQRLLLVLNSLRNNTKPATTNVTAPVTVPTTTPSAVTPSNSETASILYYADSFEGGYTSLGDVFSQSKFSAARCNIALGTLLQVQYADTSVLVKANDRPNCTKHPDIVDLTTRAFATLAPISKGRLSGSVTALGKTPDGYEKRFLAPRVFESLSVTLDSDIANTYLPGESIRISGQVTNGAKESIILLKAPSGKKVSISYETDASGRFNYLVPLDEVGKYTLVAAAGQSFYTSNLESIYVLPKNILDGKALGAASTITPFENISFERRESGDLSAINILKLPTQDRTTLYTATISSSTKTVTRSGMGNIAFYPSDFTGFSKNENVQITITASPSSTVFSMDTFRSPSIVYQKSSTIVPSYEDEKKEPGLVSTHSAGVSLEIPVSSTARIRNAIYLITPSGNVISEQFNEAYVTDGILTPRTTARADLGLAEKGQYILEVMYETGFPAFNTTFNFGSTTVPLLANEYDTTSKEANASLENFKTTSLAYVNAIRETLGKSKLTADDTLSKLAQSKAADMAEHNYVGHYDSEGKTVLGTAKRAGIMINGGVGENVAGGTVSIDFLIAGLALSGGHRANMIDHWESAGFGVVRKNERLYYVQVFGQSQD